MIDIFRTIPMWLTLIITALLVYASIWAGYKFAARKINMVNASDDESSVTTVVTALMGLLAFILAFTFGATTSRYDERKHLLLDEVNAIETVYLRAGLIPEPQRTAMRSDLKKYVDLRIEMLHHPENVLSIVDRSGKLQETMWSNAEALAVADLKNPDIIALFIDALNTMIDLQTSRVTVSMIHRIPPPMVASLYVLIILSMMGVGYLFGMSGKANKGMIAILSLSFALVITMIIDLDRSGSSVQGFIRVNQKPMLDLQQRLQSKVD